MSKLAARLREAGRRRVAEQLWRQPPTVHYLDPTHALIDGRVLTIFCNNDYLGLAHTPELADARHAAAAGWGSGSTASALVCGRSQAHQQLEQALAAWTGRQQALLFSTGYMANTGVLQALLQAGDVCIQDKLNHASLIDGARLAGCQLKRYPHADLSAAQRQLQRAAATPTLLATDGVFSMDGDVASLAALAALAQPSQALLLVDDAHGLGILGPQGAGTVAAAGLSETEVPLLIGTLGKAIGCAGAFVAGPATLIEDLAQFTRSHVYSTAPPPALAEISLAAVQLARQSDARRSQLQQNIDVFRAQAQRRGLPLLPSKTPIQPLLLGDPGRSVALSNYLADAGYLVSAIRPPTVPRGLSRLRITLTAAHQPSQILALLEAIDAGLAQLPNTVTDAIGSTSA